jgi:hypothetical protein
LQKNATGQESYTVVTATVATTVAGSLGGTLIALGLCLISPSTSPPKTYLQFRWTIVQEDSLTENFFVQSMTVLADIASVIEELQKPVDS